MYIICNSQNFFIVPFISQLFYNISKTRSQKGQPHNNSLQGFLLDTYYIISAVCHSVFLFNENQCTRKAILHRYTHFSSAKITATSSFPPSSKLADVHAFLRYVLKAVAHH